MTGQLLTVAEVAERCAVSTHAVRRAIGRGELAATRAFNTMRVAEQELERYLDAQAVEPRARRPRPSPSPARRSSRESGPGSLARLDAIEREERVA